MRFPLLSICIFWIFIFPDFCKTSGLFSLGFFGWFSLLVILWFFGDLFELFIFPLCLPLLWYVFSRFSCSRFLWGLTLFSLGFFGWFSLLVICKFLVMFLNSLFFLCVSLYLWYVFFWVFIYWFLWCFRVFSLSFLLIFNSGEFFHFYNFDFFLESCWAFPPCPPTQWCVEVINPNFCSNDSRQWSTLFERGQGEGWKQNLYSAESLWFFWVCVIVKICRVQRCNVERVEKRT